jgi:putative transposase
MSRELNFSRHNLAVDLDEVKEMFGAHLEGGCRHLVREVLGWAMECDLREQLQASWNERTDERLGYRNGFRERVLLTSFGEIELKIPRDRQGLYKPDYFQKYKRVDKTVDESIRAMFVRGVSTRKVGEVLEVLTGRSVSSGYVSQVCKALDETVRVFENSPLDDDYAFLFLDGLHVRIRCELHVKSLVLLFAYGIKGDGTRRFLSFRLVRKESYKSYLSFLENIEARGLKGKNLKLIIMDGALGLWSAIEEVYPEIPHQLCWAHKLRNVSKYCPRRHQTKCLSEASKIMYAKSPKVAARFFREWKAKWGGQVPKAVACLERDFDKLIPVFEFPEEIRKIIRTTNVIERCFREVRRRLKVMGYFQDNRSCKRIVMSLVEYFNVKWTRRRERIGSIAKHFQNAA